MDTYDKSDPRLECYEEMGRFGSKVPGQQIGDPADRMVGNVLQHQTQVGFRINAVQLGGTNQTVDCRRPFATRIRSRKQIVLSSQGNGPQRPFGGVVVDLDGAVFRVTQQRTPASQRIANRRRDL